MWQWVCANNRFLYEGAEDQVGVSRGGLSGPGMRACALGDGAGRSKQQELGAVLTVPLPSHRRMDTSITCTVPEGALPAPVSVCVRFERRGCVHSNLTFQYMQNPVITAISPRRSPVR